MVIPALILATGVALPLHQPAAFAAAHEGHWHSALADHPVESGRPRPSAHQRRPRALHKSLRQARDSAWYVLTVPQLERPSARLEPRRLPVLRPGLLLHATGQSTGNWIRTYVPGGRSWIYRANVRPAAAPRGWLKIHPVPQRRVVPQPRVSPPPVPATGAAAVLPAAPAATPAVVAPHATAVPQVVQVAQVAQPAPAAYGTDPASVEAEVVTAGDAAFGPGQGQYMANVVRYESNFVPTAINAQSGACTLFQANPCQKQPCSLSDVPCQINWGIGYIRSVYGTPAAAWYSEQTRGWY